MPHSAPRTKEKSSCRIQRNIDLFADERSPSPEKGKEIGAHCC